MDPSGLLDPALWVAENDRRSTLMDSCPSHDLNVVGYSLSAPAASLPTSLSIYLEGMRI